MVSILDQLIDARKDIQLSRYLTIMSLAIITYDWVLGFSNELMLFSKSRFSLGKILYYFIRFLSFFGLSLMTYHISNFRSDFSRSMCVIFTWVWPLTLSFMMFLCYWLLTLRLIALYRSKSLVVYGSYAMLCLSFTATAICVVRVQLTYTKLVFYIEPLEICGLLSHGRDIATAFYPSLIFETTLTVVTAYRAWGDVRGQAGQQLVPLLVVLYRDGAIFYFIIVAVRAWNIYIFLTQPLTTMYLAISVMWAAFTILTTRAYLNLCEAAIVRQPEAAAVATVMTVLSHNHSYSQSHPPQQYSSHYNHVTSSASHHISGHHQVDESFELNGASIPAYHSTHPAVLRKLRSL
ncbi:SubName: Full=Uncharacterized protein {ECO:0000313/EMBL:CCA69353.1} [Serendipita indica DSM 11827]|uniref:DUF6533 domain-containing protein n=1 Tax=Serendipita indica (strain DSM 11827) TaxID=1109443 RepID=G4TDH6_SERID|nr:SubName: Full=Uncharacterized protein {ECO:0000313/EMBL:CCA69353.1} [Serendipita indica DSM 11827]CCA69353.1 hypothetical protein PIIN_03252 [Serendipita indica DSM 11827]